MGDSRKIQAELENQLRSRTTMTAGSSSAVADGHTRYRTGVRTRNGSYAGNIICRSHARHIGIFILSSIHNVRKELFNGLDHDGLIWSGPAACVNATFSGKTCVVSFLEWSTVSVLGDCAMSYQEEFNSDAGWSAVDVSSRLNNALGAKFVAFLREHGVDTVIRYYASENRPKTLTPEEALFLSKEGFAIVPVFQDRNRAADDFSSATGTANARSALEFAQRVGQPIGKGSTILFAVDADFTSAEINKHIVPYFDAVKAELGDKFRIGAYGSGAVLARLLQNHSISVPWLSMSRKFLGTEQFFYSKRWAMRQVPPERKHESTSVGYDVNVVSVSRSQLGGFQVSADGQGTLTWDLGTDAVLGNSVALTPALPTKATVKYVTTEGLRLRVRPSGTVVRELTIGERLVDIGAGEEPGWRQVRSGTDEGYAHEKYLRDPERPEVELLLRAAIDEWLRFDKGRADERAEPYCGYVGEMWAALGEAFDGRSRYPNGDEVPWSAAFISWVVRKAGPAYAGFKHATGHSVFVHNAIKARVTGQVDKPFWGFRINEERPALGDIIQRNRAGNFSFSYAENHLNYASHSDIVVEVMPDVVRVVGGNVDDTVTLGGSPQEYNLDADGFILPGQRVIALLKNRAGLK